MAIGTDPHPLAMVIQDARVKLIGTLAALCLPGQPVSTRKIIFMELADMLRVKVLQIH
jgi:hypothetical protein